jgi:hypothetical protein
LSKTIVEQNGEVLLPEQEADLLEIGNMFLNSYVFLSLSGADISTASFDSLMMTLDENVKKKLLSKATISSQYEDLLVELYCGAWHKSKGHAVKLMEDEGPPDLVVQFPRFPNQIYFECKKLRTPNKARIQADVKDANKKFRHIELVEDQSPLGVLFLDVTSQLGLSEVGDEGIPDYIQETVEDIRMHLTADKNRLVSSAVVVWDDFIKNTEEHKIVVAHRRRFVKVENINATLALPDELPLFEGFTACQTLNLIPRRKEIKEVLFSDSFKKICQTDFQISRSNAARAVLEPDKEESLIGGGKELVFYVKEAKVDSGLFLLIFGERKPEAVLIHLAFKIYGDMLVDIDSLTPLELLERFANKFGLPVTVGNQTSTFIAAKRIKIPGDSNEADLITIHADHGQELINPSVICISERDGHGFTADVGLAYCIDKAAYVSWLAGYRK